MNGLRVFEWYEECECTFPKCACNVPDYAFSSHNRKEFCDKWKQELKEQEEWNNREPDREFWGMS